MASVFFQDPASGGGAPNWSANHRSLEPGAYNWLGPMGLQDNISWITTHPNHRVTVYQDSEFRGGSWQLPPGSEISWSELKARGFNDAISSLTISEIQPADLWRRTCCRNETTDTTSPQKCGELWSQSRSACGNLGCTGETLQTDPVCQTWCRNNPEDCDSVKLEFCRNNPDHRMCGCINDTPVAYEYRNRYPSLVVPRQCFGNSDCQKTDLVNTFVTTDLQRNVCPTNLTSQIQEIDIRNSTVLGSTIGAQSASGATTPVTNWFLWFVVIFVVILAVAAYVALDEYLNLEN